MPNLQSNKCVVTSIAMDEAKVAARITGEQ